MGRWAGEIFTNVERIMNRESTAIDRVYIITPESFSDERGFFMEAYRKDKMAAIGITESFVQDSHSRSKKGVLRGLHFQWDPPMAKIVRVARGKVFFVIVDIRKESPTFRKWISVELSDENRRQVYLPTGCAGGFFVLSEIADVLYKHSSVYNPAGASEILWNDRTLAIDWPTTSPILSPKDQQAQTLDKWLARPESDLVR